MAKGFIKLIRSREIFDMIQEEPNVYLLLSCIAIRTNLFDESLPYGCRLGEALVSPKAAGLKDSPFRTAKRRLENRGIAVFDVRQVGSSKRTFARLLSNFFFDLNFEATKAYLDKSNNMSFTAGLTGEAMSEGIDLSDLNSGLRNEEDDLKSTSGECEMRLKQKRIHNKQEIEKKRKEEIKKLLHFSRCSLTRQFTLSILEKVEVPILFDLQQWESEFHEIIQKDGIDTGKLSEVIKWFSKHRFWGGVILTPVQLRKSLPQLLLQMDSNFGQSSKGVLSKKTLQEDGGVFFK
jgi:hypothetical protein